MATSGDGDLSEEIEEAAERPKKSAGDFGSVERQSIDDLIKADRYLAAKRAKAAGKSGLSFKKLVPPGAS